MRVLLTTTGSNGDVRPFVALARRLLDDGHTAELAAVDHYAGLAAQHGVPFHAVGKWDEELMQRTFREILAKSSPLDQLEVVLRFTAGPAREAVPFLLDLAPRYDVVVYPPLMVAAPAAARKRGVRHVSVQLAPIHPARGYSPLGPSFGRLLNGVLWSLAGSVLSKRSDPALNEVVKAAGLAPWKDVMLRAASSTEKDLVAVSPAVMDRDPGWPAASVMTGYWFLDEPNATVDEATRAFVEREPPVVVGFGSMTGFDVPKTMKTIVDAARALGAPVLVQSGWAGFAGDASLPKNVHVAPFVPHDWLFPRARCVVHHGGAGTTAAAVRAGVPQCIVWHLGDQPVWARRMRALGVAPKTVRHDQLTAAWLEKSLRGVLASTEMATKAKALGERVRAEDGLGRAVEELAAVVGTARGA